MSEDRGRNLAIVIGIGMVLGVATATFALPPSSRAQSSRSDQVQPMTIRLREPARVGFPIWLYADLRDGLIARYPFGEEPNDFGSNRLELKRDGQVLNPRRESGGPIVRGLGTPPRLWGY